MLVAKGSADFAGQLHCRFLDSSQETLVQTYYSDIVQLGCVAL